MPDAFLNLERQRGLRPAGSGRKQESCAGCNRVFRKEAVSDPVLSVLPLSLRPHFHHHLWLLRYVYSASLLRESRVYHPKICLYGLLII